MQRLLCDLVGRPTCGAYKPKLQMFLSCPCARAGISLSGAACRCVRDWAGVQCVLVAWCADTLLAHLEPTVKQQRLSKKGPHAQVRTLQSTTVQAMAPPPEEGDTTAPERIAGSAAAFLDAHLRMKDVRQYLLDLLNTYAALR